MTPLALTIKAAARALGLGTRVVAGMCDRGELAYNPCLDANGKPSRVHKRIPVFVIEDWQRKNLVRGPEDLKRMVDGRRR